jgi:hypothetical protein
MRQRLAQKLFFCAWRTVALQTALPRRCGLYQIVQWSPQGRSQAAMLRVAPALTATALFLAPAFAQDAFAAGCDSVLAAQVKGLDTSSRSITKFAVNGGGISTLVSIAAGGKIYSKIGEGTWKTDDQPLDRDKLAKYWMGETCTSDGSETIDGDSADSVEHRTGGFPPMDTRFWISRSSGLIVKTVVKAPGSVITTEADYRDVRVPMSDAAAPAK